MTSTSVQVNATSFITAINHNDPRERVFSDEITEELRAILKLIEEGLQGYGGWIETYALNKSTSSDTAAQELNQLSEPFSEGYSQLATYLQQFPHPADIGFARSIEELLENLLRRDIAKLTVCQSSTTVASWGEMIHPAAATNWSLELVQQFTQNITYASWKASKDLIDEAIALF